LDSSLPAHSSKLAQTLQRSQRRGNWRSSAFHIDSSRQITAVGPPAWSWDFSDPTSEEIGWDFLFNPFQARFQDTIHAIYRLLGHHRTEIAKRAIAMQHEGAPAMPLDFPDPLARFREAFNLLLGPKTLADIDISSPQIRYIQDGVLLGIEQLSSGEKEAFNIVFDLLLRQPEDCIIFFDEPELHLHPELSFRLLKTLQVIGARNQFLLLTHSADIISSALEHSVILLTPQLRGRNQAVKLQAADDTVTALRELGQNLGVISLGRRIVLIEGAESSIDRDTYGAILQAQFPGFVLAPSGGRQTIISFSRVVEDVLQKTIWGIDFYMLADRDNSLPEKVLSELEGRSSNRLRFLPRLHIENYFLDEGTIAEAFADLVPASDWRRDANAIRERLQALAGELVPMAVNRWLSTQARSLIGEIDLAIKFGDRGAVEEFLREVLHAARKEELRISGQFEPSVLEGQVKLRWKELSDALGSNEWKRLFPGKVIFGKFCGQAGLAAGFLRTAYIAAARRRGFSPFEDVLEIFRRWA
jgi:putative AbiEii toxin of type IV toxin-antitoxin system